MILHEILQMPLVDHHAHGVMLADLNIQEMGDVLNESSSAALGGAKAFDKPVGFNIRTYCAPVLDLPAHVPIKDYVERRNQLGATESSQRLIAKSGMSATLLDTYSRDVASLTTPAQFADKFGVPASEILRIESIFENVAMRGVSSTELLDSFANELSSLASQAVGLKSIVAYRTGFRIDTDNPDNGSVNAAIDRWRSRFSDGQKPRLDDPVICARLLWIGAETARDQQIPIQFHVGIGDGDVDMPANDPGYFSSYFAELQKLGVPVTLLHCYPYVRTAQWLADIYDNVYFDIGFMLAFGSQEISRIMRESMEVGPFHKVLYSSDAFSLAELFHISAHRFRNGLAVILQEWVDTGYCSPVDALRIARMVCSENATRLYRLDERQVAGSPKVPA